MTIYVDDVGIPAEVFNKRTGKIVSSRWYHLITDQLDPAELHEFACGKLKLHRSYFQAGKDILDRNQRNPGHDHYDLTVGKRWRAINLGAIAIDAHELGRITLAKTRAWRLIQKMQLCPACVHPMGEHEHQLEYAPTPSFELIVCQHPTCDCTIER